MPLLESDFGKKKTLRILAFWGAEAETCACEVMAIRSGSLLLDEAMSMLDPTSRKNFLELIKMEHSNGRTVVQVTHRLDEILWNRTVL